MIILKLEALIPHQIDTNVVHHQSNSIKALMKTDL